MTIRDQPGRFDLDLIDKAAAAGIARLRKALRDPAIPVCARAIAYRLATWLAGALPTTAATAVHRSTGAPSDPVVTVSAIVDPITEYIAVAVRVRRPRPARKTTRTTP